MNKLNMKDVYLYVKENIGISPNHIIACKCNNEVKSLNYEIKYVVVKHALK